MPVIMSDITLTPDTKTVSFRRAKIKDITAIKSMVDTAYSKYIAPMGSLPAPMTVDYYELLKTNDLVIMLDTYDKLIGCMAIDYDPSTDSMIINNLVVDPAAQAEGYAQLFIDYALDIAWIHGCKAVALCTNFKMQKVFRRYIVRSFEEIHRVTGDGYELVFYNRSLV